MTMTNTTKNPNSTGKKPTHTLYGSTYINGSQVKVRVGVAWQHDKGNGFNISLDNMVMFENRDISDNAEQS